MLHFHHGIDAPVIRKYGIFKLTKSDDNRAVPWWLRIRVVLSIVSFNQVIFQQITMTRMILNTSREWIDSSVYLKLHTSDSMLYPGNFLYLTYTAVECLHMKETWVMTKYKQILHNAVHTHAHVFTGVKLHACMGQIYDRRFHNSFI